MWAFLFSRIVSFLNVFYLNVKLWNILIVVWFASKLLKINLREAMTSDWMNFFFFQNATTEQYFLQGITVSTKLSSEAAGKFRKIKALNLVFLTFA